MVNKPFIWPAISSGGGWVGMGGVGPLDSREGGVCQDGLWHCSR